MVASFYETQSNRENKRGLPDHLWVLQRAVEGRSGRTERSKGAQGRIMHQRPENWGALNKPIPGSNNPSRPTNQMSKKCPRSHSLLEGSQKHLWRASILCKHTAPALTAPFLRQETPDPGVSGFYPASVPIGHAPAASVAVKGVRDLGGGPYGDGAGRAAAAP